MTKVTGKHTFKAGYELIRTRYNGTLGALPGGTYNFGGTDMPFTPNTGNTFASFLLGSVNKPRTRKTMPRGCRAGGRHQWYFQDDWKPARGLTVNLGLRWSYEISLSDEIWTAVAIRSDRRDPLTGKIGAITHPAGSLAKKDLNNFAPRVGMAWSFNPNWVFRGSFGMIHQDISGDADLHQQR